MTDHPAPNPNQPDALVEKAARLLRRVANRWDADYDGWESLDDEYREDWRNQVRAVLAAVLPEVERHAKADALRDAARDARHRWGVKPDPADWLTARADQIEKGDRA